MRNKPDGFTLVELLVTIGVISVMMGLVVSFFTDRTTADLKKESAHLMAMIRFAYNEAATRRVTHRIVFDLSGQNYILEEGTEDFKFSQKEDAPIKKAAKKKSSDGEEGEESGEEEAAPPPFVPVDDPLAQKVSFKDTGLRLRDVYIVHQAAPLEESKAYLYFFPNGMTEQAIIHLSGDEEDADKVFALIVNPLTGKCRIETTYVDYQTLNQEVEE